jgi:hypothetical protein
VVGMVPQVIASRRKSQAPPPHIVWDELNDAGRPWLLLRAGEIRPTVIEGSRPDHLTWSSPWIDRPTDRIRFDLVRIPGPGTMLTWTLTGDECDAETGRRLRYRINELINRDLRAHFDC